MISLEHLQLCLSVYCRREQALGPQDHENESIRHAAPHGRSGVPSYWNIGRAAGYQSTGNYIGLCDQPGKVLPRFRMRRGRCTLNVRLLCCIGVAASRILD
jgi:hypothetical protein